MSNIVCQLNHVIPLSFWRALPVEAASAGTMDPRVAMSLRGLALAFAKQNRRRMSLW